MSFHRVDSWGKSTDILLIVHTCFSSWSRVEFIGLRPMRKKKLRWKPEKKNKNVIFLNISDKFAWHKNYRVLLPLFLTTPSSSSTYPLYYILRKKCKMFYFCTSLANLPAIRITRCYCHIIWQNVIFLHIFDNFAWHQNYQSTWHHQVLPYIILTKFLHVLGIRITKCYCQSTWHHQVPPQLLSLGKVLGAGENQHCHSVTFHAWELSLWHFNLICLWFDGEIQFKWIVAT